MGQTKRSVLQVSLKGFQFRRNPGSGAGEFGTYFIGYARSPRPIELMLENMFVGRPPGNYDRLLDFSHAVTGGLFFVPSADLLEALADRSPAACADTGESAAPVLAAAAKAG